MNLDGLIQFVRIHIYTFYLIYDDQWQRVDSFIFRQNLSIITHARWHRISSIVIATGFLRRQ